MMLLIRNTLFVQTKHFFCCCSQSFMLSESETLQKETLMPVYVAPEDEQLLYMYEEVKQAAATRTSSIFVRGK